jgi:excisionase family DNA binding protein
MNDQVRVPRSYSRLLTPAEAAAVLHVDANTLARWATAGRLTAVRTPGGHRRYLTREVIHLLRSQRRGGR